MKHETPDLAALRAAAEAYEEACRSNASTDWREAILDRFARLATTTAVLWLLDERERLREALEKIRGANLLSSQCGIGNVGVNAVICDLQCIAGAALASAEGRARSRHRRHPGSNERT